MKALDVYRLTKSGQEKSYKVSRGSTMTTRYDTTGVDMWCTVPLRKTALTFLKTFLLRFEKEGFSYEVRNNVVVMVKQDVVINFMIKERQKRAAVNSGSWIRHELVPAGLLLVKIYVDSWNRKEFINKYKPLEEYLGRMVDHANKLVAEEVELKLKWAEQERKEKIERKEREECERLEGIRQEKLNKLRLEVSLWREAEEIRAFAKEAYHVKQRDQNWFEWAMNQADQLDPLVVN
jgi:hypothetical protein